MKTPEERAKEYVRNDLGDVPDSELIDIWTVRSITHDAFLAGYQSATEWIPVTPVPEKP